MVDELNFLSEKEQMICNMAIQMKEQDKSFNFRQVMQYVYKTKSNAITTIEKLVKTGFIVNTGFGTWTAGSKLIEKMSNN